MVEDVSLQVRMGQIVCLLGPNGAGKTTLMRMAATLARPSAGTLRYHGVAARNAVPAVRSRIGFASHHSLLYPDLTVAENLRFHSRLHGVAWDRGALLEAHGLEAVAGVEARHLSRGTAQRASLARALLHEPDLLLLDEPFSGLDGAAVDRLVELLVRWRERGAAVLVATHDVERGLRISDRAAVLHRGRLVLDQAAAEPELVKRTYRRAASGRLNRPAP